MTLGWLANRLKDDETPARWRIAMVVVAIGQGWLLCKYVRFATEVSARGQPGGFSFQTLPNLRDPAVALVLGSFCALIASSAVGAWAGLSWIFRSRLSGQLTGTWIILTMLGGLAMLGILIETSLRPGPWTP